MSVNVTINGDDAVVQPNESLVTIVYVPGSTGKIFDAWNIIPSRLYSNTLPTPLGFVIVISPCTVQLALPVEAAVDLTVSTTSVTKLVS